MNSTLHYYYQQTKSNCSPVQKSMFMNDFNSFYTMLPMGSLNIKASLNTHNLNERKKGQ